MPTYTDSTIWWNRIERAVDDEELLRRLDQAVERAQDLDPRERDYMRGRIDRYLDDHSRQRGERPFR